VFEKGRKPLRKGGGFEFAFGDYTDVLLLTAPLATGVTAHLIGSLNYPDHRYHLVVEAAGRSQRELAGYLLYAFIDVLIRKNSDFVIDSAAVMANVKPFGLAYRSFPASCWGTLIDHPKMKLVRCKTCGTVVFTALTGKPREFCSDACRFEWNKRQGR
jgi:hypothetical protein